MWEELVCDIINLTSNDQLNPTPFCILGDMNGRVGEESEFATNYIQANASQNLLTRTVIETIRRNGDKTKCITGEKIIQLCKSYDIQIANGRFPGDFLGNFTHHNKNTGQSTVDLALISDALYPNIDDFKVLPQTEYSDHCKIVLSIKNIKHIEQENNQYKWLDRNTGFKWDKTTSPNKFKNAINTPRIQDLIYECKQRIEAGLIESSGKLIQNIFIEAANLSLDKKEPVNKPSKKATLKNRKNGLIRFA